MSKGTEKTPRKPPKEMLAVRIDGDLKWKIAELAVKRRVSFTQQLLLMIDIAMVSLGEKTAV
jgi:hypothetical protein